jgi:putative tryptophan/tyrosine transport system substrate-binding protein
MRRRDFVKVLGGTVAAWPLAARAQQSAMPVIGLLSGGSPELFPLAGFRQGLQEAGIVEGKNAEIEARWARRQFDRLPGLAADLVGRRVVVIITATLPGTLAAKAATSTIPMFSSSARTRSKWVSSTRLTGPAATSPA